MSGDFEQAKSRVCQSEGAYVSVRPLASSWEQRELGDCLSLLRDGTHGTHADADEGPFLLSAKNIKDGELIINFENERKISWNDFNIIHSSFSLAPGDVLMTIVGTIGESTILKSAGQLTFQRSVAYLRPNENSASSFLCSTIGTKEFKRQLEERKSVSAQPGVYLGDLKTINIFLPAREEQLRIGAFFSRLDDLIALHQREPPHTMKEGKNVDQHQ